MTQLAAPLSSSYLQLSSAGVSLNLWAARLDAPSPFWEQAVEGWVEFLSAAMFPHCGCLNKLLVMESHFYTSHT